MSSGRQFGVPGVVLAICLLLGAFPPAGAARSLRPADDDGQSRAEQLSPRGAAYSHLMRAVLALRQNEFERAAEGVRRAVELQPDSAEVHIQGANLFRRMARYSESEELVRSALELEAGHPEAIRLLADLTWERLHTTPRSDPAQHAEAIGLYESLVAQGTKDDLVLQRLANLKLEAGDPEGALEVARLLVELRPGDRSATASLAQLLLAQGREREALAVVLRFIGEHPDDAVLIGLADRLVRNLGAWDVVADELSGSSDHWSGAAVQRLLAESYMNLGRSEEAAAALEDALAQSPEDAAVRYNLAGAYRRMGRLADSISLMRELADSEPSDPRIFLHLAETLDDQNDTEGSLNAFNTALRVMISAGGEEAAPLRDAIRRRMATLYVGQSRYDLAQELIDALEKPDQRESHELKANLAIAREDWKAARQSIRWLAANEAPGFAAFLEGEVLVRTGRPAKAVQRFESATSELGPFTRVRAAEVFLNADEADLGTSLLRGWIEQEPENAGAHYYLGSYLYRTDRFDEAEPLLREAFRLNPDHAPALNFLGYGLAERRVRLDEALVLIQRALSLDSSNGAYLDSLGWVYYQMGRYPEAREPLERAAREYPHDGTVLEHLGDLYLELGEADLAYAAWRRALGAGAEDDAALRAKLEMNSARDSTAADDEASATENRGEVVPPPIRP